MDREPSLQLLVREQGGDARVRDDRFRLVRLERGHELGQGRGDRQQRSAGAPLLQAREDLSREVEGARRSDRRDAGAGSGADTDEHAQCGADPDVELPARVRDESVLPGRAGGRTDAELVRVELGRILSGRVRLDLRSAQTRVGHDPVELGHEGRLGEHRQVGEPDVTVGDALAEHVPVVGRAGHGVPQELAEPLALEAAQLIGRPGIVREELRRDRAPVHGVRRVRSHLPFLSLLSAPVSGGLVRPVT